MPGAYAHLTLANLLRNTQRMEPPPMFVFEGLGGINAITVGPDAERSSVFITRPAADTANDRELMFILGHEMGHIKSQHSLYLTVASFLAGTGIWALRKMDVPGAAYIRTRDSVQMVGRKRDK